MINKTEYELLKSLKQSPEVDNERYFNELRNLLELKMIYYNIIGSNSMQTLYDGYIVTPIGDAAIEEYERMLEKDAREVDTLNTAHEANNIAKNANKIAEKSNVISKIAIVVSILAIVVSVIGIIVSTCVM